eukprot:1919226-Rhodomonas_salina.3
MSNVPMGSARRGESFLMCCTMPGVSRSHLLYDALLFLACAFGTRCRGLTKHLARPGPGTKKKETKKAPEKKTNGAGGYQIFVKTLTGKTLTVSSPARRRSRMPGHLMIVGVPRWMWTGATRSGR